MTFPEITFVDNSAPYITADFLNSLQAFVNELGKMIDVPAVYTAGLSTAQHYILSSPTGVEAEEPTTYPCHVTFIPTVTNAAGADLEAPWEDVYPIYDTSTNAPVAAGEIIANQPVDMIIDGTKAWVVGGGGYLQYTPNAGIPTAGYFDRTSSAPVNHNRLNYDGDMYATRFYGAVYNPSSADVAEGYPVKGECEPGDVIAINPDGTFSKNEIDCNTRILGIVSDEYAVFLGEEYGKTPIAECGRIHAKVRGFCSAGDLLYAEGDHLVMCADDSTGIVVARALEMKDTESIDKVLVRIERR